MEKSYHRYTSPRFSQETSLLATFSSRLSQSPLQHCPIRGYALMTSLEIKSSPPRTTSLFFLYKPLENVEWIPHLHSETLSETFWAAVLWLHPDSLKSPKTSSPNQIGICTSQPIWPLHSSHQSWLPSLRESTQQFPSQI